MKRVLLVVDDDQASVVLTRAVLADVRDVEIIGSARNGREALTLAAATSPDVILMDLQMPVMDGAAATRKLREAGSRARIVIVTGSDDQDQLAEAREAGADALLRKPQTREALLAAILADDPPAPA